MQRVYKMVNHKPSIDVVLERLENIKEDMEELKESVKLLQEDYIIRRSYTKIVVWVASALSAGSAAVVTMLLDKFR